MSYANISDDTLIRLEHAQVSRDARLLHFEGFVYSATALTDGEIRVRLARISDAVDPDALAGELVAAGFWQLTEQGYMIVDFLIDNRESAEVEQAKTLSRERKKRSRLHRMGDHSMCYFGNFCPFGTVERPSGRDKRRTTERTKDCDETLPHPLPSPPGTGRGRGHAEIEPEGLTLALAEEQLHEYVDCGGVCATCSFPKSNRRHSVAELTQ